MLRKLASYGIQKNIVMDGDMMIDKRTDKVWDPEADSTYWKRKYLGVDFMAFVDHKIT